MTYRAPVDDIVFALKTAAGLPELVANGTIEVDEDTVRAVIEEAGRSDDWTLVFQDQSATILVRRDATSSAR